MFYLWLILGLDESARCHVPCLYFQELDLTCKVRILIRMSLLDLTQTNYCLDTFFWGLFWRALFQCSFTVQNTLPRYLFLHCRCTVKILTSGEQTSVLVHTVPLFPRTYFPFLYLCMGTKRWHSPGLPSHRYLRGHCSSSDNKHLPLSSYWQNKIGQCSFSNCINCKSCWHWVEGGRT